MSSFSKKSQVTKKRLSARQAIVAARKGFTYSILALMPTAVIVYCSIDWLSGNAPSADGIAAALMASLGASAAITALAAIWAPNFIRDPHQKRIWIRFMIKTKSFAYTPPKLHDPIDARPFEYNAATGGVGADLSCRQRL